MQRTLTSVDWCAVCNLHRQTAPLRAALRAAAVAIALAGAAGARAADPRATLDDAWREFFFQMYDKADRLFARALRETAAAPALRAEAEIGAAMLAQFRETGGDVQRAIGAYERLLNSGLEGPPRALCLSMLAEAYATQQRDADADRLWDEVITRFADLPIAQDALLRRTAHHLRQVRSDRAGEALRYLDEKRKLFPAPTPEAPGLAPAFDLMAGEAHFWRSEVREARAAWERYVKLASPRTTSYAQYASVTLRVAQLSERLGEPEVAGRYYRHFVEQTPNDVRAYYALERAVQLGALTRDEVIALRLYGLSLEEIDRLFARRAAGEAP